MFTISALIVSLLAVPAVDSNRLQGSIESAHSDQFRIQGIQSSIELSDGALRGEIHIDALILIASGQTFEDISVACGSFRPTNVAYYCNDARITATFPGVGRQTVSGTFSYSRATATARFLLLDLQAAGSTLRLSGTVNDAGLDISFSGNALHVDALIGLAQDFSEVFDDYSGGGLATIKGRLRSGTSRPTTLDITSTLESLSVANDKGTIAAENIQGDIDLAVTLTADTTRFTLQLNTHQGEAYLEPVYASFGEHALSLFAEDVLTSDFSRYDIPLFRIQQDSVLDMSGDARLFMPKDEQQPGSVTANIHLADTSVTGLYTSFVQVLLAGTIFGDLETDGRVSGQVRIENNLPTLARLRLDEVILDDAGRRFSIYGLNGIVDWPGTAQDPVGPSEFHWDSAMVYNIIIGGGDVGLRLGPADVELLAPLRIPLAGGALRLNQLALHDYGSETATGILDAELEPVQLSQLTGAIGWPPFSGRLSGRLPSLTLSEETMMVGGSLTASAFDGGIEVSNLRIERPFGRVPRLYADLRLRQLDLERLTNVFSFGLIQGRLSGDVTGLEMIGWRTTAMDMHFYTPPDDRSRRRISQRAVENLASVGGGGAGAMLSSGLMQFFEVFSYDRIGLRCILRDGSCAMSGAGASGDGYYIVKGSGLPRIDVVGFKKQVSWSRLVRQLTEITRSNAPTVE
jgi:hypothetical protein